MFLKIIIYWLQIFNLIFIIFYFIQKKDIIKIVIHNFRKIYINISNIS